VRIPPKYCTTGNFLQESGPHYVDQWNMDARRDEKCVTRGIFLYHPSLRPQIVLRNTLIHTRPVKSTSFDILFYIFRFAFLHERIYAFKGYTQAGSKHLRSSYPISYPGPKPPPPPTIVHNDDTGPQYIIDVFIGDDHGDVSLFWKLFFIARSAMILLFFNFRRYWKRARRFVQRRL